HDRLADLGAKLIVSVIADIDHLTPIAQREDGITYAHKIDKSEARIDWTKSSTDVDAHIRGLSPFPGAWCMAGPDRIKILQSQIEVGHGQPGEHLGDFVIACGVGAVRIQLAQREGKKPLSAEDFLRGITLPNVIN
ncbi:MAG: methionyl-tRNA formyltransferase, partial [Deltaproteobacteria bacterium]